MIFRAAFVGMLVLVIALTLSACRGDTQPVTPAATPTVQPSQIETPPSTSIRSEATEPAPGPGGTPTAAPIATAQATTAAQPTPLPGAKPAVAPTPTAEVESASGPTPTPTPPLTSFNENQAAGAPLQTGRLRWKFLASNAVRGTPIFSSGLVLVGADDGRLYAVDAATGELSWRIPLEDDRSLLAAADDVAYATANNFLHALDPKTGEFLWSHRSQPSIASYPIVADGVVYIAGANGVMYAIDAASGESRWENRIPNSSFPSSPGLWQGAVYISSTFGTLYAFDAASGEILWEAQTSSKGAYQSPVVGDGAIYLPNNAHLYAFDASDGSPLWKVEARLEFDSRMTFDQGVLYFDDRGNLRAIEAATGADLWQRDISPSKAAPTVLDGVIYVGTYPFLYALDAVTGETLWTYETEGFVAGSPVIEDGVVYFGSTDDYLYALSIAEDVAEGPPQPQPEPAAWLSELTQLFSPRISEDSGRRGWGLGRVIVAASADGSTLVLGDPAVETDGTYGGAAFVFTREEDPWDQVGSDNAVALLAPDQPEWKAIEPHDYLDLSVLFGTAVAVSGDGGVVAIGAAEHGPPGRIDGAVHVFIRPVGGWHKGPRVVTLLPPTDDHIWKFGESVAISADGQTIVAGLGLPRPGARAAAYVFTMPVAGWSESAEVARLAIGGNPGFRGWGSSLATSSDGSMVVLGLPEYGPSGAAVVFVRQGSEWTDTHQAAILVASDGASSDFLGQSVSVSSRGDTVVAGAPGRDAYAEDHGAAYVFARPLSGWTDASETAKLSATDGGRDHHFGASAAVNSLGDRVIVLSQYGNILGPAGVYLFSKQESRWQDTSLPATNPHLAEEEKLALFGLGASVSVGDGTIVFGGIGGDAFVLTPSSDEALHNWLGE